MDTKLNYFSKYFPTIIEVEKPNMMFDEWGSYVVSLETMLLSDGDVKLISHTDGHVCVIAQPRNDSVGSSRRNTVIMADEYCICSITGPIGLIEKLNQICPLCWTDESDIEELERKFLQMALQLNGSTHHIVLK